MESNYRNIKEQFKFECTIGKGTFATVKQAKDRISGELFAVKIFSKRKMNESDTNMLFQEIDVLK